MADWRRLSVGFLVLGMLVGGCGREGNQLAVPAVQPVAFAPQGGATTSVEARLTDMGNTLELSLQGQGFQPGGIYSVEPLVAFREGDPASAVRSDDTLPEVMPALSDGRVVLLTTFQTRGTDRPWIGFGVFHHPNGDANDERNAQLVLFGPMPTEQ